MAFVRDVEVHVEAGHMDRIKVQPGKAQARGGVVVCVVLCMHVYIHELCLPCTVHRVYEYV